MFSFPKRYVEDKRRIRALRRSVKLAHAATEKKISDALARGDEAEVHRLTGTKHKETAWDEDEITAHEDFILTRTAGLLQIHIQNSEWSHDTHPNFSMLTGEGRSRVSKDVRLRIIKIGIYVIPIVSSLVLYLRHLHVW